MEPAQKRVRWRPKTSAKNKRVTISSAESNSWKRKIVCDEDDDEEDKDEALDDDEGEDEVPKSKGPGQPVIKVQDMGPILSKLNQKPSTQWTVAEKDEVIQLMRNRAGIDNSDKTEIRQMGLSEKFEYLHVGSVILVNHHRSVLLTYINVIEGYAEPTFCVPLVDESTEFVLSYWISWSLLSK